MGIYMILKNWVASLAVLLVAVLLLAPAAAMAQRDAETRSVRGNVTDKAGNALEKAVVYLKNTKNLQMRTHITDAEGAFRFQGLVANVDYEVHAEHQGASSPVRTISGFDSRREVNISLRVDK
jgi:hypothetical protein